MSVKNAIILGVGLADNASKQIDQMAGRLRAKMRTLASVGSELTQGLTFPILAAGAATLKFSADLDAMKKALEANMGSASAAAKEFDKLREAAKAPGIGLEQALRGSVLLQGLGSSADQARTEMLALAKAVALSGGGASNFGSVMTQFAQMKGQGRIMGQDLRFMIENAPILSTVLKEAFGSANAERIRDMGISVEDLTKAIVDWSAKTKGVEGSLKNTLENIWDAFKIGLGEIGLATLGVTNWAAALDKLTNKIQETTKGVVAWIKEHPKLTKAIGETLAVIAISGPLVRFIANLGLIASGVMKIIPMMYNLAKSIIALNTAGGKGIVKGGILWAVTEGMDAAFDSATGGQASIISDYYAKVREELLKTGEVATQTKLALISAASIRVLTGRFGQASELLALARGEGIENNVSNRGGFGGISPAKGLIKTKSTTTSTGLTDEQKAAIQKAYEAKIRLQREMERMFAESPVKSRYEISGGLPEGGIRGIQPNPVPIETEDMRIMKDYEATLRAIAASSRLGGEAIDIQKDKVDAAADAYLKMEAAYPGSTEAADALNRYIDLNETYLDMLKKQTDEQKKQNMIMEQSRVIMGGVADGISSLVTDGKQGMGEFAKSILKAVSALIKLAIAEGIANTLKQPGATLLTALPQILAGGAIVGLMEGLINSVSLAKGGVLTGESLVRAGEYSGVRANPEVIAPLNTLKGMLGDTGGSVNAEINVGADELVFMVSRGQQRAARRGSGSVIRI